MKTCLAAILALCACTPHPDTARRALLELGLGRVVIQGPTLSCTPRPGLRFSAVDADGAGVTGRVCCLGLQCDVVADQALNTD